MRLLNVIGIALTASVAVAAAYAAKAQGAEPPRFWLEGLAQPVKEMVVHRRRDGLIEEAAKYADRDAAIGLLRKPGEPLTARRTSPARHADAFEREIKRRFHSKDREVIAYMAATPLQPSGRRVAGFVSRVEAGGKTCDYGVIAYSETADSDDIYAVARVVLCEPGGQLISPDVRLTALLSDASFAE